MTFAPFKTIDERQAYREAYTYCLGYMDSGDWPIAGSYAKERFDAETGTARDAERLGCSDAISGGPR